MLTQTYKIQVLSEENHLRTFDISQDVLLLGRSHSCDIRFSAPDVSGRHIEIHTDEFGKPVLHNLSMRTTTVNGKSISHESIIELHADDSIQLGDDVLLKIICGDDQSGQTTENRQSSDLSAEVTMLPEENTEESTVIGPSDTEEISHTVQADGKNSDSDTECDPATAAGEKECKESETIVMQTRIASPEEIELLRKQQNLGSRKKIFANLCIALMIAGIIAAVWYFSEANKETSLSWPLDAKGNFNDEVIFPNTEAGRDFLIYFPRYKNMKVTKQGNNSFAETRIGKSQDVVLRLEFRASKSLDHLYEKRESGFRKWMDAVMKQGGNWNFDAISEVQFRGKNNGFPYQTAKYNRVINDKSWFGIASYMKFRDWEFVLLKEIPSSERWRGESLLERESFISVSSYFIDIHWEYNGQVLAEPVKNLLAEARSMLDRTSPAMWAQISNMLISVMIRSLRDNNLKSFEKAQQMMAELRHKQTNWLNSEKIEYFNALAKNKYKDAQRIRDNCRCIFSDENDQRFHFIRRDQWE